MAEIIKMPKLSDTMEEGVVAKWHVKVGEKVGDGDLLADIETDKATMEFESFQEGVLLYQGVKEGEAAKVDSILAIVGEEGEEFEHLLKDTASSDSGPKSAEDNKEAKQEESKKDAPAREEKSEQVDVSDINASIVKMPKLSDTMKEGTVAKWYKQEGDKIESGEILADIETDKATMEFESFEDGTVLHLAVKEGESAPVDDILAIVGEKGADIDKLINAFRSKKSATPDIGKAESKEDTEKADKSDSRESDAGEDKSPVSKDRKISSSDQRIKISPLAKRLANEQKIDPKNIKGSGEGGRIIKRDIEDYQPAGAVGASVNESYEDKPVSQMRKTIAKRLAESKFSAPHFYLNIDLDMTQAVEARKAINELPDTKISFNDLVVKAAAMALRKHPQVNSSWMEGHIRSYKHIHIGVAVAVEDGLLVPVVRFADNKQLSQIGAEVKEYAEKARNKKLQPEDWEGSTFSISNLGMFGIDNFTAIINPPNACIMAIGAIRDVPVVKNGTVVPGKKMKISLSCDHRVVDGATGAEFLQTFKNLMENPVAMLA